MALMHRLHEGTALARNHSVEGALQLTRSRHLRRVVAHRDDRAITLLPLDNEDRAVVALDKRLGLVRVEVRQARRLAGGAELEHSGRRRHKDRGADVVILGEVCAGELEAVPALNGCCDAIRGQVLHVPGEEQRLLLEDLAHQALADAKVELGGLRGVQTLEPLRFDLVNAPLRVVVVLALNDAIILHPLDAIASLAPEVVDKRLQEGRRGIGHGCKAEGGARV
mmetsp:Transcript_47127/g.121839  ORF Transcript_47127/g.121839 Transcript_47127/m.121839 type:complete len:224 (-) Transcript_47127:50-721(-)